jgi:hypothetical protein
MNIYAFITGLVIFIILIIMFMMTDVSDDPEVKRIIYSALTDCGPLSGRELRGILASSRIKKSGASFYLMMSHLENEGMIEGYYLEGQIGEYRTKERHYRLVSPARPGEFE